MVLDDGRVSDDIRVELPAAERAGGPAHAALRARLLSLLGVEQGFEAA